MLYGVRNNKDFFILTARLQKDTKMQSKYNAACLNCFNINNFYFSKKIFSKSAYLFVQAP